MIQRSINKLIKEPLVHFLALGALIFLGHSFIVGEESSEESSQNQIVIDQRVYDHLRELWKVQWRRNPNPKEITAIIDRYVRQEVFYREALSMNLDRNDEIVKKRLAQKMEAVATDLAALMQPPTEKELKDFFLANQELFIIPQTFSFKQVLFFSNEKEKSASIGKVFNEIERNGKIPKSRFNKLSVPNHWKLKTVNELKNAFGVKFTKGLEKLPVGKWAGPVYSGYGWHYVFIEKKEAQRGAKFEEVKDLVEREYAYRREYESQDNVFKKLLTKYSVDIKAEGVPAEAKRIFEEK